MFKRNDLLTHIMNQFPGSFITVRNELILDMKGNVYFKLDDITCEVELKYKLLEWVSRDASKAEPYSQNKRNEQYQDRLRNSINNSLNTNFKRDEMRTIYQKLGNQINRELTVRFVESNYDFSVLMDK